jgi:4,5:9,10-diseco-3-hydroxy-5,9,17-trioxoandrosta-1(10),2-diene-4-oate hydrolase
MNNIQSKNIKVDGLDVHYYTAGEGDPLVVIHGGGGDARSWEHNISDLARKYAVYALDLPGYGLTQPLKGKYYIPELADFVQKFTKRLGLKKFSVVGHSLGGGVALDLALKIPTQITKLVLVSSLCLGNEVAFWLRLISLPAIIRSAGTLFILGFKAAKWLISRLNLVKYILPLTPVSMAVGVSISDFHHQTLVLEKRLPEVKMPTLLIWGARDPVVPVKQAYRAAKMIPDCRLQVFQHRGHNVHREEFKKFSSLINDFLG